jgi:hypothetical protein
MKIGDTVFTKTLGSGVVTSIVDAMKVKVNFNGEEKIMLKMLLKIETPKAKKVKKVELDPVINFTSVVNGIKGDRTSRGSMFVFSDIYTKLERLAFDEEIGESELAGKIIEDARSGKYISEKQACVVAYFARKNNLIK